MSQSYTYEEEIIQKQKQQKIESIVFEKKYGEDRMSILQQFFLTEEQFRNQINENIIQGEQDTNLAKLQVLRKGLKEYETLARVTLEDMTQTRTDLLNEYIKPQTSDRDLRIAQLRDRLNMELQLHTDFNTKKIALSKDEQEMSKKYNAKNMEDTHKRYNQVGLMLKDFADSSTQALISSGVAAALEVLLKKPLLSLY
jgi:hypothetical protein